MQMLSSTILCPRCGAHAMLTVFGSNGADSSLAEVTFSCPNGDELPADVSRADVLEAWSTSRAHEAHAG